MIREVLSASVRVFRGLLRMYYYTGYQLITCVNIVNECKETYRIVR